MRMHAFSGLLAASADAATALVLLSGHPGAEKVADAAKGTENDQAIQQGLHGLPPRTAFRSHLL